MNDSPADGPVVPSRIAPVPPPTGPAPSLDARLRLYETAVQHPLAEVAFLERVFAQTHGPNAFPQTFREDFAGTASVAAAWCLSDPDREALAVENHPPTAQWAEQHHRDVDGLQVLTADVLDFHGPRVDVLAALNFSVLTWHDRPTLLRYFKHARRCLVPGGVFAMDLFGGPDATRPQTQTRPSHDHQGQPVEYRWEQRHYNPLDARIDCRIHFGLPDGQSITDAFVYDWRLWTPAELLDAFHEAGFQQPQLWSNAHDPAAAFAPVTALPNADDAPAWVVYLTGSR